MLFENRNLAPYQGSDPYLFLSYSHRDVDAAAELIDRLKQAGFRLWYDEGIVPGTEWDENIANKIAGCGYFIALISKAYLASSNCRDELNYARDREKPRLLIYLEEVTLPAGMEMRLNRLLAIHKYKYGDQELFWEKVFQADGIEVCRETPSAREEKPTNPSPETQPQRNGGTTVSAEQKHSGKGKIIGFLAIAAAVIFLAVFLLKPKEPSAAVPPTPSVNAAETATETPKPSSSISEAAPVEATPAAMPETVPVSETSAPTPAVFGWSPDELRESIQTLDQAELDRQIDLLFQEAVKVSDYEGFKTAIKGDTPVILASDIEIPSDSNDWIGIEVPLLIPEGCTLAMTDENRSVSAKLLVNRGSYRGQWFVPDGIMINEGSFSGISAGQGSGDFRTDGNSICINYGDMNLCAGIVDFGRNTFFLNKNRLVLSGIQDDSAFTLNGVLQNTGDLELTADGWIQAGARLLNDGGTLNLKKTARLDNFGTIKNTGRMELESGSCLNNTLLINNGELIQHPGAELVGAGSVMYGTGSFSLDYSDQKFYRYPTGDKLAVSDETALRAAMENDDVKQILLSDEVSLQEDLLVTKPLLLENVLRVGSGSTITVADAVLVVDDGGSLILTEDASMILDASLFIVEKADLESASVDLRNGAAAVIYDGKLPRDHAVSVESTSTLILDSDTLELQNAAFSTAGQGAVKILGQQADLKDSKITMNDGSFTVGSVSTALKHCDILVGENAFLCFRSYNLVLGEETKLENHGEVQFWDGLTLSKDSTIQNDGYMLACMGKDQYKIYGDFINNGSFNDSTY